MLELREPLTAALRVLEYVADRTSVLALQAGESLQPLLDILQPARQCLLPERIVAQLSAEVLELVHQRLPAL